VYGRYTVCEDQCDSRGDLMGGDLAGGVQGGEAFEEGGDGDGGIVIWMRHDRYAEALLHDLLRLSRSVSCGRRKSTMMCYGALLVQCGELGSLFTCH